MPFCLAIYQMTFCEFIKIQDTVFLVGDPSVIFKTKLESFLTPSERIEELVSYREIEERFNIRKREGDPRVND